MNINGSPGFTNVAFNHLKEIPVQKEKQKQKVVCNLCVAEISIKSPAELHNGKSYGYPFIGSQEYSTDGQDSACLLL